MVTRIRTLQICFGVLLVVALGACSQQGSGAGTGASAPAAASAATGLPRILKITSYGPTTTKAGEVFNRQPNGGAAIWIRLDHPVDGDTASIDFNGTELQGNISGNLVTAGVPAALYAHPGTLTIQVIAHRGSESVQSNTVSFTVE